MKYITGLVLIIDGVWAFYYQTQGNFDKAAYFAAMGCLAAAFYFIGKEL